jgi:drug/metabolite transporter (DMT)-like permease
MNSGSASTGSHSKGYIVVLISTILWSSAAIFIVQLKSSYHLEVLQLTFWRNFWVFLLLLPVLAYRFRSKLWVSGLKNKRFFLLYGTVLASYNLLFTVSAYYNGASVSTVLSYSSVAITSLIGWKLWGESLGKVKLIAIVLCITGCVFVSGASDISLWRLNPVGIITGLLSGVAFAGYSLMGKEASRRGINPWLTLLYTFGVGALILFGVNLVFAPLSAVWMNISFSGWVMMVLLALVATIGGYGLYNVSLDLLPASVANLIVSTEPVFTAIQSYIIFGEVMTAPQIAGSLMLLGGVLMLRLADERTPQVSFSTD